ncbi:hypothetical protein S40285_02468 [Stachybotrys chlorohalonatus IBT 40285]|uniref:Uncharacterized protein n=1 Tax=Stachybotrys chlorohalonatus (strain IBT 40285) TaxID=1283841 RepID=A0A084R0R8_STAC4|nr:hypothetical protein S40285_02468 [Stachybotrys chlorohalonata IBT 40285]
MKSVILALAPLAVMAEAIHGHNSHNGHDSHNGHEEHSDTEFKVPYGVELPEGAHPMGPPCDGCTDVFHPPHHGVDIDDCDRDDEDEWHWVHPGAPVYPDAPPHVWATSTVTEFLTSTIIDCKDDVPHCPGKSTHYTTIHVPATVTLCPVPVPSESYVPPPPPTYAPPPTHKTEVPYPPPAASTPHYTILPTPVWSQPAMTPGHPKHSHPAAYPSASLPPSPPAKGGPSVPHHSPAGPWATPSLVAPPAVSAPPYPACGHSLCPKPSPSQPGTIGVPYPPAPSAPGIVTAGAAHNIERAGLAVLAGLVVAMI